jgi:phage baseplate assembly protein W
MATTPKDTLLTDLCVVFTPHGQADLNLQTDELERVSGRDNLVQALSLRLLTERGELTELSHPRYGSRLRELIGEPLDRANIELLRRYVRKCLLQDPRVAEVVTVRAFTANVPGVVVVQATVRPIVGAPISLSLNLDLS